MIRLNIGSEATNGQKPLEVSRHLIDLKNVDAPQKQKAHQKVTVNLKQEIEFKKNEPDKLHIVGEKRRRKGLGRMPMLAAALFMILLLNIGQMIFLGKHQGEQALALAAEGFMSLKGAGQSFISGESGADVLLFNKAQTLFTEAKNKGAFLLNAASPWMDEPGPVQSLNNVLEAGSLMAEVGTHLSAAKEAVKALPAEGSLTQYLRTISQKDVEPAAEQMQTIQNLLKPVDLSQTTYEAQFKEYRDKLDALANLLKLWVSAKDPLLTALGDQTPQTYLVLLQNNDEMRLGGGFIGSVALVTINDGHLSPIDFHDVYEFDNNYFTHQPVPVPELTGLTTEWRLRDSNFSADFPTSAQKAAWFLEQEGGPGVDGVIAINLSAAQAFLEKTGNLKISSLSKPLTAENFPTVLTTLVESKSFGATSPKSVLSEVLSAFTAQLSNPETAAVLGQTAWDQIQKKQISIYHKDPRVETFLESLGMTGSMPKLSTLSGDFFLPTFENISGNKTDRYIQTELSHDTQLLDDGSMVATIQLTRSNTFTPDALSWIKKTAADYGFTAWNPTLEGIMGAAPNKSAIRFYLPEGAQLLNSEGIFRDEIRRFYDADQGLSYFYLDQTLNPGESKTLSLQFSLPLKFRGSFQEYNFEWFKQPGLKSIQFQKTVTAPTKTLLSTSVPATDFNPNNDYVLSGTLKSDLALTLLYR